jgi:hypothetical protein
MKFDAPSSLTGAGPVINNAASVLVDEPTWNAPEYRRPVSTCLRVSGSVENVIVLDDRQAAT